MDVTVVVLAYDQLDYTRNLLDSLRQSGIPDPSVVVVNNGSTDGTGEFLAGRPELRVVTLMPNQGFGSGWNAGARASTATWTVLFNNDVLVAPGWLEGLLSFAKEHRLGIVSPAMREGALDYDLPAYADQFVHTMAPVKRLGVAHGVCIMIHRRVFDSIGVLVEDSRLGGYEDDEFFRRARRAGIRMGITGRAFIHHFRSVTQDSIKARLKSNASLGDRDYYRKKYGLTWFVRRKEQARERLQFLVWRLHERGRYGRTLREKRTGGVSHYG